MPAASRRGRWLALGAFTAALWALVHYTGLREQIGLQPLREAFAAHQVLGWLTFTGLFALANLVHVPGAFFLAAAVLTLGPVWGGLATYGAACVSCTVTFGVVRALGGDALRSLNGRLAQRLFARLDAQPVRSVVLLRLAFHSVPALNYALALSGVRWQAYLAGTLLGLPVPIAVAASLFDTLALWFGWVT